MSRTLESYNNYADRYRDKFSVYLPYTEQIKNFTRMFKPDSRVLDIGCGPGLNSAVFSEAGHEVSGFDFSESMIAIAKENCPNGIFTVSSVSDFESEVKYDVICLSFIIVHLEDEEADRLIKSLSGMLAPDGLVYISFMTGKVPGWETTSFSESEIYFNYYKPEYITDKFESNGYSLEYSDSLPYKETDGSQTEDIFLVFKKGI